MTRNIAELVHKAPLLSMQNVSKTFGPVKALRKVNLNVSSGEVHSLMGENGAGKSTLMKILTGAYQPDPDGEIEFDGHSLTRMTPTLSRDLGIAVIYQELSLAPNLTVAENIFLGCEPAKSGFLNRGRMKKMADPILKRLGVDFRASTRVSELSLGQRQEVEIARALAQNAKLVVMDEPTTSLTQRETEKLFRVIKELRSQGIAIIYISHRMEEIYELSDACTVLRDGETVGTLSRSELSEETLVNMMVGRDLSSFYRSSRSHVKADAAPVLKVKQLTSAPKVQSCSFSCMPGEILGISGLVGSGRTELARAIFGADDFDAGTITLDGQAFRPRRPSDALEMGLNYLTEDRKELGLFLEMSVSDNVNISVMQTDAKPLMFRNFGKSRDRTRAAINEFSIRTDTGDTKVGNLSGGNQQKALLARMLETKPKVLILDEPTRGVDIGAKSEIYATIDRLAERGVAIIVISSDLPEIVGICDRVLVMRDGGIAGEVRRDHLGEIQSHQIMNLATGAQMPPVVETKQSENRA